MVGAKGTQFLQEIDEYVSGRDMCRSAFRRFDNLSKAFEFSEEFIAQIALLRSLFFHQFSSPLFDVVQNVCVFDLPFSSRWTPSAASGSMLTRKKELQQL